MTVCLILPYPPSTNVYWRHRALPGRGISVYVSKEGKEFKDAVAWIAKTAGIKTTMTGRVELEYHLYPQQPKDHAARKRKLGDAWHDDVRSIDLDNAQKALFDSLSGVVFDDDKQVHSIIAKRMEPDGDARLVVTVRPIAATAPQGALI